MVGGPGAKIRASTGVATVGPCIPLGGILSDMRDEASTGHAGTPGYLRAESPERLVHRLKRVEGQVRGIQKMVEEGRYCVEIMTQIDAAAAALARVQDGILESHLQHCVADALEGRDVGARREKVDEVVTLLRKYRRSAK